MCFDLGFTANKDFHFSAAGDVYSLGVNLWELATRQEPHAGKFFNQIFTSVVVEGTPLPVTDDDIPSAFVDLIRSCCSKESKQRPITLEVLNTVRRIQSEYHAALLSLSAVSSASKPVAPFAPPNAGPSNAGSADSTEDIYEACTSGNLQRVRFLVTSGAVKDIDEASAKEIDGALRTPLQIACYLGHLEVVKYLITEAKADPNRARKNGVSPLYTACGRGHLEVVKYLITEAKADVNKADNNGASPLHAACGGCHLEVVKYLITQAKADVKQAMNDGASPLYVACHQGHLEVVKYLITQAKADVKQAMNDGTSPLFIACQNGHPEVVKYLITQAKADVKQAHNSGASPLFIACQQGHLEVVKYLITEAKADVKQAKTMVLLLSTSLANKVILKW